MRLELVALCGFIPLSAYGQLQPGSWKFQIEVLDYQQEGATQQMIATAKKPSISNQCVTQSQAKEGPLGLLRDHARCSFDKKTEKDGKFDIVMVCPSKSGDINLKAVGTYTPIYFSLDSVTERNGKDALKMHTITTASRIGECK